MSVMVHKRLSQSSTIDSGATSGTSQKKPSVVFSLESNELYMVKKKKTHQRTNTHCLESVDLSSTRYSFHSKVHSQRPSLILTAEKLKINDGIRRDAFGTPITKNSHSHQVTFIDDVSRNNLAEVILISKACSSSKGPEDKVENLCSAGCKIF